MIIDKTDFNDSKLSVNDFLDEEKELEISIMGGTLHDRSVWLTKEEIKLLIETLIKAL